MISSIRRVAQRADGVVDENAAIVERHDLHAGREPGLNLRDLLLDGGDHFARVGAVANDDHAADRFLAVLVEHSAAELRPQLHAAHVAQCDGRAVGSAERDIFDVLEAANQADAAHDVFGVTDLDHLGADVVVTALRRRRPRL